MPFAGFMAADVVAGRLDGRAEEMTVGELKRALVEVKKICSDVLCMDCPFGKRNEYTGFRYCPLETAKRSRESRFPFEWEIDDWKEDSK